MYGIELHCKPRRKGQQKWPLALVQKSSIPVAYANIGNYTCSDGGYFGGGGGGGGPVQFSPVSPPKL